MREDKKTITSFPEASSESWTCVCLGTATFLFENTLSIIRSSKATKGSLVCSIVGLRATDDSGSKK